MRDVSPVESSRAKQRAARVSVVSNSVLVTLKLVVGLSIGSIAVISEAIHSSIDLLAAIIAFLAVRVSDRPADQKYPFGRGKVESVSGTIEAALIFIAGVYIIYESVLALLGHKAVEDVGLGIAVMAFSAVVNVFVARNLFRVAKAHDSVALEADAHHLSVDVMTSVGVVVGLVLVQITGIKLFDPIVAIAVGLFILKTAYDITRSSFMPLLDVALPQEELSKIEEFLRSRPAILGWHKLRSRKSGPYRQIDLHVQVADNMSLVDSHALAEELEKEIRGLLPKVEVIIHVEPFEAEKLHRALEHGGA